MKKAERIFHATYTACRVYIKRHGIERNVDGSAAGFNHLHTEEVTCRRTWNAIQKMIDSERRNIAFDRKHGIMDAEYNQFRSDALDMVQSTLNNTIKSWQF